MAKKFGLGLGNGLDALMGKSEKDKNEIIDAVSFKGKSEADAKISVSSEKTEGVQSVAPAISVASANLPAGIEADENGCLWVDPALLKPNPHQPRTEFDQKALEELAESVKEHGIVEPIIIEKKDGSDFYIIAGERRTRAARLAGLAKVPVQIRKFDEQKKLEVALIENIQRANLNPVEEAQAYYNLMQMSGLTQEEVAKRVGKSRPVIANSLRLLKLPEDMLRAISSGQIDAGHARSLLSVTNPADMRILFGEIIGKGMNCRQSEERAKELNNGGRAAGKKDAKKTPKKDPDIAAIEQKFIEVFGTKVVLKGSIEKGSIQIDYFSKQDLDRLYNVIVPENR